MAVSVVVVRSEKLSILSELVALFQSLPFQLRSLNMSISRAERALADLDDVEGCGDHETSAPPKPLAPREEESPSRDEREEKLPQLPDMSQLLAP